MARTARRIRRVAALALTLALATTLAGCSGGGGGGDASAEGTADPAAGAGGAVAGPPRIEPYEHTSAMAGIAKASLVALTPALVLHVEAAAPRQIGVGREVLATAEGAAVGRLLAWRLSAAGGPAPSGGRPAQVEPGGPALICELPGHGLRPAG